MTTYTYIPETASVEYYDEFGTLRSVDSSDAYDTARSLYDGGWRARDRADIKSGYFADDDGDGVDILIQWIVDALKDIAADDTEVER